MANFTAKHWLLMDWLEECSRRTDSPLANGGEDNLSELALTMGKRYARSGQKWDWKSPSRFIKQDQLCSTKSDDHNDDAETRLAVNNLASILKKGVDLDLEEDEDDKDLEMPAAKKPKYEFSFKNGAKGHQREDKLPRPENKAVHVSSQDHSGFTLPSRGNGSSEARFGFKPSFGFKTTSVSGISTGAKIGPGSWDKKQPNPATNGTAKYANNFDYDSAAPEAGKRSWNWNRKAIEKVEPTPREPSEAFRTAHEQLIVNSLQQKGISSSSYGGVGSIKKSLGMGARPVSGGGSGFKPPLLGPNGSSSTNNPAEASSEMADVDERLKSIEPKMIELIRNEIMDSGATIGWDDIAGLDFVKTTVKEVAVYPLLRPGKHSLYIFTGLRAPPKGILLFGPPGTGKTLIGKCIASQSNSTFFSISASSLTSKWVGEGEKMVRALFAVARVHQPSVVFIDEIDSLLTARSDTEHESSRRIKTEFLVQLDGATTVGDERILVVGATNRPQDLDEAARRRLVKRLYVPLPEAKAREQIIIQLLSQATSDLSEPNLKHIVNQTEGYSGADMANLCKDAAMGPIRELGYNQLNQMSTNEVRSINSQDFLVALKQVKASVSDQDLALYLDWNKKYGSG